MTEMDSPVFSMGCGVRVAVTTTSSSARATAATSPPIRKQKTKQMRRMATSRFEFQEPWRENRPDRSKQIPAAATPDTSPQAVHRTRSEHPVRAQDDGARQVSWLPVLRFRPPSQGL